MTRTPHVKIRCQLAQPSAHTQSHACVERRYCEAFVELCGSGVPQKMPYIGHFKIRRECRKEDELPKFERPVHETQENAQKQDNAGKEVEEHEVSHVRNDGRPSRTNAGRGVERLEMTFDGKTYGTMTDRQFTMIQEKMKGDEKVRNGTLLHKVVNAIFAQVPARQALKHHRETAIAAAIKEFTQLAFGAFPGKPAVEAIHASTLSDKEKKEALSAVNLVQYKDDGRVKWRTCANGSDQRKYLSEDESVSSPTMSTEAMIGTLVIDVFEERDIAIFDIPGAYLHAKMPEEDKVILKLAGIYVDIMCEACPEFKKFVTIENGQKVLYMNVLRAIYGCLKSGLLWYDLYSTTLKKEGYILNRYDRCIANKMIRGKQCTMGWYVDDNKLSHVDSNVVAQELEMISKHFGDIKISRGKEHRFLGMDLKITDLIAISMKDRILEAIEMIDDVRYIGATSLHDLYTWIDASYGVHPNMRGHTGGVMSMGIGVLHARSSKQKINVKSTTECEIVGTSEYCPYTIWKLMFLEDQGYPLRRNILFQDNKSSIKMEKNGRNSCTENSRHIHTRYFFVKDRVDKGEIVVEYCPIELMLADYFTKPLTGALFHKFRNIIMGYVPITEILKEIELSSIKERVRDRVIEENEKNKEEKANLAEKREGSKVVTFADVVNGKGKGRNSGRELKGSYIKN